MSEHIFKTSDHSCNFLSPPRAGYWQMGSLRIYQQRKPGWIARLFSRWLLEWEWVDIKP